MKGRREGWLGEQSCAEQVERKSESTNILGAESRDSAELGRAWPQGPDRKALPFPTYQDRRTAQP